MYETITGAIEHAGPHGTCADATEVEAARGPIDREHLKRYTLGDPVLEREVLGLFLAQLPLTLESLKFARSDKDWHMAAHTLKGSARAVGAWELARLALEAEKVGRSAGGATTAIVARLEEAVADIEQHLRPAEVA